MKYITYTADKKIMDYYYLYHDYYTKSKLNRNVVKLK